LAGEHLVEFNEVSGWAKPGNRIVTINPGQTASLTGTYTTQTGSLRVTISPQRAIDAGAKWRRVGTSKWRSSGTKESEIPAGQHEVEFKDVSGWTNPGNQTVTIASRQVTTATGVYVRQTGSLCVTISPQGAIDAGAKWRRVDTSTWRDSGTTETGIRVGQYTVEFRSATGWRKPSNQTVMISDGQTTESSGTYTPPAGSLRVTISPQRAIDAGAKWRRVGTSKWRSSGTTESGIPPGQYTVEFKDVSGWTKPGNQTVTITSRQTTTTKGVYVR
jgi:hypothetical protein